MTDLKRASNGHIEDTRRAVAAHEIQIDATAGCPRNCSEALIKDVGFVAIGDGKWEIYIGGAGAPMFARATSCAWWTARKALSLMAAVS
jgi:NAD(P)H-nitrite reductase large subunit